MKIDIGFAEDIVSDALAEGADHAEAFVRSYKNLSIEIRDQAVESLTSALSSGYALRVIKDQRLGFSFSTDVKDKENVIRNALGSAEQADRDMHLCLPEPSPVGSPEIFDPAIRGLTEDDAVALTMLTEKSAYGADARIRKVRKPSASFTVSETMIVNSNSLRVLYETTSCSSQITAVAESGGESRTGWDYAGSRFLRDVPFEDIGKNAAASAVRLLGSKKIQGAKMGVILDNSVAVDFLGVFASSLSSDAVQKGKSLLAGKLGSRIISPKITILDSGTLPRRLGSKPADDEGVRTGEKALVREGVLLTYLYNTYTAKKGGTSSTGNAVRGGFSSLPSIGITNLYLEPASPPDNIPKDRLFASLQKGLYIVDAMGVHTVNPISGDFSIGVTGLWIENGEIAFPVKEAVISGNLLDFFSRVEAIGNDMRFYGSIGAPSLLIPDIDVSA